MLFFLQNDKTRSAWAKAGSLALAAFIKRPQAELQIGAWENYRTAPIECQNNLQVQNAFCFDGSLCPTKLTW